MKSYRLDLASKRRELRLSMILLGLRRRKYNPKLDRVASLSNKLPSSNYKDPIEE